MPISFPSSPTVGQTYTYVSRTWQWDGSAWTSVGTTTGYSNMDGGKASSTYGGITPVQGGSAGSF